MHARSDSSFEINGLKGFDVQLNVTNSQEITGPQNSPRGKVQDSWVGFRCLHTVWAFGDTISSHFKQRFLQDVEEQYYMDFEEAVCGGDTRGRRMLRIAGKDGSEYMHMKNSPWLIKKPSYVKARGRFEDNI
jgi:hypothetical protein